MLLLRDMRIVHPHIFCAHKLICFENIPADLMHIDHDVLSLSLSCDCLEVQGKPNEVQYFISGRAGKKGLGRRDCLQEDPQRVGRTTTVLHDFSSDL